MIDTSSHVTKQDQRCKSKSKHYAASGDTTRAGIRTLRFEGTAQATVVTAREKKSPDKATRQRRTAVTGGVVEKNPQWKQWHRRWRAAPQLCLDGAFWYYATHGCSAAHGKRGAQIGKSPIRRTRRYRMGEKGESSLPLHALSERSGHRLVGRAKKSSELRSILWTTVLCATGMVDDRMVSKLRTALLDPYAWEVLPHTLILQTWFPALKLKELFRDRHFPTLNDLNLAMTQHIQELNSNGLLDGVKKLPDCWKCAIEARGTTLNNVMWKLTWMNTFD